MNLQSLMKQAQSMQKNMLASKKEIEEKTYEGKSELVKVKMSGKKELISVEIDKDQKLESDDLEVLEDMIVLAVNDAIGKINKDINDKMGNQAGDLSSLF